MSMLETRSTSEFAEKHGRVLGILDRHGLAGLAINTTANFAWYTCGASNYVGIASEIGSASLVITRDRRYAVCDNIEAGRMATEELAGMGFEFVVFDWHEPRRDALIAELAPGKIGSDTALPNSVPIAADLDEARQPLVPEEVVRYRELGRLTAQAMSETCRQLRPGMTEHEASGALNARLVSRGIVPVVTLVAADERIEQYRHPLPTDKTISRRAMLVTGARKWGLIVSTSRLVSFGPLEPRVADRHRAVTRVDAAFISATNPGRDVADVFAAGVWEYERQGYPEEWRLHHQGGPTGYKGREFRATLQTHSIVAENQAFAWNPSITGTKSEDTIIATSSGPEVLSMADDWPVLEVETESGIIRRPDILVL